MFVLDELEVIAIFTKRVVLLRFFFLLGIWEICYFNIISFFVVIRIIKVLVSKEMG